MCAYSYKEKLFLISDDLADDLVSPHDYPYLTVVPTSGTANHHPKPERAKVSVVGYVATVYMATHITQLVRRRVCGWLMAMFTYWSTSITSTKLNQST